MGTDLCFLLQHSHNLVIGGFNDYTSIYGIVIGEAHGLVAPYATILGGHKNKVTGEYGSIIGGTAAEASGKYSAVLGGNSNKAIGDYSTVVGGQLNKANGKYSAVRIHLMTSLCQSPACLTRARSLYARDRSWVASTTQPTLSVELWLEEQAPWVATTTVISTAR